MRAKNKLLGLIMSYTLSGTIVYMYGDTTDYGANCVYISKCHT